MLEIYNERGLKTLKNLAIEGIYLSRNARLVSEEELKQEVIKWIKELTKIEDYKELSITKKFENGLNLTISELDTDGWADGFVMTKAVIHWIKHFFNISDEDLK